MLLHRRKILTGFSAVTLLGLSALPAYARKSLWFSRRGVAIRGYDPVSYFTDAKAVRGKKALTSRYSEGVFYFSSAQNKALFDANPEKYAPQYGGYCAYAVANNYTASTDPEAWSVHDGKLYLNYSKGVRRRWLKDIAANIAAGDKNWPSVLG